MDSTFDELAELLGAHARAEALFGGGVFAVAVAAAAPSKGDEGTKVRKWLNTKLRAIQLKAVP